MTFSVWLPCCQAEMKEACSERHRGPRGPLKLIPSLRPLPGRAVLPSDLGNQGVAGVTHRVFNHCRTWALSNQN